jgi:AraC family transcriptional regulator, regulatory protein of adaptative response / methylated-DNA-[protein]-cysteine methyltransferase
MHGGRRIKVTTNGGYLHYLPGKDGTGELKLAQASYQRGGAGARMAYAVQDCAFGRIMAAATVHGLTWLGIHESATFLEAELRRDYPRAEISGGDEKTQALVRTIVAFVLEEAHVLEIPVDIRATPFQAAVWSELCAIPHGSTRSYSEIAVRIARPGASRAVGHANGSNPLAIVIPCHRAIGADGSLTGYRWGIEYKRRLLELEGARMRPERARDDGALLPFPQ